MNAALGKVLIGVFVLSLTACFHVELAGPVAGATVVVTELKTGVVAQANLKSSDQAGLIMQFS